MIPKPRVLPSRRRQEEADYERLLRIMRRNDEHREPSYLPRTWPQTIVTDDEDEQ